MAARPVNESNVIPGFRKMSKQRILNLAVAHMAVERQASVLNNSCVYSGTGCNAAPLIRREMRDAADRIGNWSFLVETGFVPANNADFIQALQQAHDSVARSNAEGDYNFMARWKANMRALALEYGLSTSTLDKVPA